MWECVKRRGIEKPREEKIKKYDTKRRTLDSWLYYSGYADDDFYILYSQLFFQTTHDRYLLFKIRLVLSFTLYKFIVWACWGRTQSCFRVQAKTGPYTKWYVNIRKFSPLYFINLFFFLAWISCFNFFLSKPNFHLEMKWFLAKVGKCPWLENYVAKCSCFETIW